MALHFIPKYKLLNMMKQYKLFNKNNPLFFIVLFILGSFILSLYNDTHTFILFISYSLISYLLMIYIIYVLLYSWRDLIKSFFSFVSFLFVVSQIFGLLFVYFKRSHEPLYLENLSYFTTLRYVILMSILLLISLSILIKKIVINNPFQPYAEIHLILFSWNYILSDKIGLFLLKKLISSKIYRIIYLVLDVISNIVFKLISLFLLINFVFLSGDLRLLINLIPFLLLTIIYSHLQYYFEYLIRGNMDEIRKVVILKTSFPNETNEPLVFSLTEYAKTQKLTLEDLPILSYKWLQLSNLSQFLKYKKIVKMISLVLSFIQLNFWVIASFYVLTFFDHNTICAGSLIQITLSVIKSPCPTGQQLIISTPPKSTDETIIDTGKQKHLVLAQDQEDKDYVIALGYLTSKNSGFLLSDKQFKVFQNEMSGITSVKNTDKIQKVFFFEIPFRIKKEDIKEAAWDKQYMSQISPENMKLMLKEIEKSWINGFKDFVKDALTKIEILQMCKDHDNTVKKKGKHPLTADQIKQQEENKKKQQEEKKYKQQSNHDS